MGAGAFRQRHTLKPVYGALQQRLFNSLGMNDTTFWPSNAQIARRAGAHGPNKEKNGYARGDIRFLSKPLSNRASYTEVAGGLFSTTREHLQGASCDDSISCMPSLGPRHALPGSGVLDSHQCGSG